MIENLSSVSGAEVTAPSSVELADLIVAYLEGLGVEYVFGIPGGAIEPLYNALARSQRRGGIRPVVARHEAGAAFMADGYARETGKLGVCCATSGPGATNLITGVACAYDNDVPMLVLTGQPALPTFGRGALQESSCTGVDTVSMFRHCTRYNSLVSHADQLEHKLVTAIMRAHQAPHGPVHLSIPVDILRSRAPRPTPAYSPKSLLARTSLVDEQAVEQVCAAIREARDVAILIGGGRSCGEAIEAILQLAELIGACYVTTPDGKGLVNPRHSLYRGVFGFAGHPSADALLRDRPDLILAFGPSLGEWTSGAWSEIVLNDRLVHIDSSDEHLLRSPMARLHVPGRIRTICERLIERLGADEAFVAAARGRVKARRPRLVLDAGTDTLGADDAAVKPQRLMAELSQRCPPTTRFVADAGNSAAWAIHYLQPRDRRLAPQHNYGVRNGNGNGNGNGGRRRNSDAGWLRVLMDFAPMGWAIGAAVGIARAHPDCPVVCLTGDGSYLMNGQEISVAAAEGLTVVFVILNDGALGMVKHGQRLAGAEPIGYALPAVDYRALAQSMGVPGHVLRTPQDFAALDFDAILGRRGPTLLDVHVDGEEVPPMNLRMRVLGTAA